MNTFFGFRLPIFLLLTGLLATSCSQIDDVVPDSLPLFQHDIAIDPALLPAPALALIQSQYAQATIIYAEREEDDDEPYRYEVKLSNGVELYFDADGNLVYVDYDDYDYDGDVYIPADSLPQAILAYLAQHYPGVAIRYAEREGDDDEPYRYEVELVNGIELYFDDNGNFLFADTDQDDDGYGDDGYDDDDIQIPPSQLPQAILDYISQHYPNVTIVKAEREEDDDEDYAYEVELSNGVELYFDANGNFLYAEND